VNVVKNAKTGIVLSDNSPKEMAEESLILLKDTTRYGSYQKNGYAWATSLTWKKAVDQSENVLKKAMQCES
jgi:glycosyltransferase involved in cell wall biosynthesis